MRRDELAGAPTVRTEPLHLEEQPLPLVTLTLILVNVLVFACQLAAGESSDYGVRTWGLTRSRLLDFPASGPQPVLTLLTSMFLHVGFGHLFGNMLYLWIFGRPVEKAMGPGRFLAFYLLAGFSADAIQLLSSSGPNLPSVGASGAVSGVLGGFLLLYPFLLMPSFVPVLVLMPVFPVILLFWLIAWVLRAHRILRVPAIFYLLLWFCVQVLASSIAQSSQIGFLAHVAGFAAGVLLVIPFTGRNYRRAVRMPEED